MARGNLFKFAERCLYNYPENRARLESLREDLKLADASLSVGAQNYEKNGGGNQPGDPVGGRFQKIEHLREETARLERMTKPVARLIEDLSGSDVLDGSPGKNLMKILNLWYFARNSKKQVAEKLNISERNIYYLREEIVRMAVAYLGL